MKRYLFATLFLMTSATFALQPAELGYYPEIGNISFDGCRIDPETTGLEKIFAIGSNQVTATTELERLALILAPQINPNPNDAEVISDAMTLIRKAFDSNNSGMTKAQFIEKFSKLEKSSLTCRELIKYNRAAAIYSKD